MEDDVASVSELRSPGRTEVLIETVCLCPKTQQLMAWQAWRLHEPFSFCHSHIKGKNTHVFLLNGLQQDPNVVHEQGCGSLIETMSMMVHEV